MKRLLDKVKNQGDSVRDSYSSGPKRRQTEKLKQGAPRIIVNNESPPESPESNKKSMFPLSLALKRTRTVNFR